MQDFHHHLFLGSLHQGNGVLLICAQGLLLASVRMQAAVGISGNLKGRRSLIRNEKGQEHDPLHRTLTI